MVGAGHAEDIRGNSGDSLPGVVNRAWNLSLRREDSVGMHGFCRSKVVGGAPS
jgi:hypothetical protein